MQSTTVAQEVAPVQHSARGVVGALQRAFLLHDKRLKSDFEILSERSGACITAVLASPTLWFFANLGDSRSVLCRKGRAAFATVDHKPTDVNPCTLQAWLRACVYVYMYACACACACECACARARASMHTFFRVYKHVEEETNGADIDAV